MKSVRALKWPWAWVWTLVFAIVPFLMILPLSFARRGTYGGFTFSEGITAQSLARIFDPLYFRVVVASFNLALLTSLICLPLGIWVALRLLTFEKRTRALLVGLLVVPFLINTVVKAFGIRVLLDWGTLAVFVGMVSSYLPLMVVPLYASFERSDPSLMEAAGNLGANRIQRWVKVFLPLHLRAIISGMFLVFVPALGEFVIPDMLGGAQGVYLGGLISDQFLRSRDWPFGAALTWIMIAVMLIFFMVKEARGKA